MLATPGDLPTGPEWTYEVKWDGMRLLAETHVDGLARLRSRSEADVTASFPDLAALGQWNRAITLDGEVVAFDEDGRPSFARLAERIGARGARAASLAGRIPVTYVIFDLLGLDGESLTGRAFRERRAALVELPLPAGPFIVPETFDDGEALLAAAQERGLEGVVAKRWDARYRPGVRSRAWVKRSLRSASDAVVVGWRTGSAGDVASLAVASVAGDGSLVYRGTAGSGISQAMSRDLQAALRTVDRIPVAAGLADDAQRLVAAGFGWCRPEVVVEITHLGFTGAGRFRQPVVARHRADLGPRDLGATGLKSAGSPDAGDPVRVAVAGRTLRISHLDKVLYPATGTTKAEVIAYYRLVAPWLLALAADRPITRRRWPDGVAAQSFFEKNLPGWAPDWLHRATLPTSREPITYPVLGEHDIAGLVWLAAHAALELHTPQWRLAADGQPLPPDRLVIDLDPGPGTGLAECARVALTVADLLSAEGLAVHPVLSGSKGLHLYAPLGDSGSSDSADRITDRVKGIAEQVGRAMPDLVVVTMAKRARTGRVFLDWSQNRAAKTTLAPWSLRGSARPSVALPVSWDEVGSGDLRQIELAEALRRLEQDDVPLPW
jgi:bifunctional non-homologous end joining protein LigD